MERAIAIKKLGKMLGKSLGYRVDPRAPTIEERAQATEAAKALSAAFKEAEAAETARLNAILEADVEYQELKAKRMSLREAKDRAWSKSRHFKITVGTTSSMFFHVRAEGDSWEEVIDKLDAELSGRKAA